MANNQGDIGGAYFKLGVDSTQFDAGLNKAQASAQGASQSIASAFKAQVGAFTSVVAKMTAVVGVFGTFYAIGEKVGNLLRSMAPDVEQFTQSIEKLGNTAPADQLRALAERMRELQNANTGTLLNTLQNLRQWQTNAQVREQIALLEQTIRVQELRLQRSREEEDKKREAAEQKAADEKIGRVRLTEAEVNKIVAEQEDARFKESGEKIKRELQQEAENAKIQAEYYNDQVKDRIESERELLRVLQDQTRELQRQLSVFDDLQRQQSGGGFGSLIVSLEAIRREVQSVRGQIR